MEKFPTAAAMQHHKPRLIKMMWTEGCIETLTQAGMCTVQDMQKSENLNGLMESMFSHGHARFIKETLGELREFTG